MKRKNYRFGLYSDIGAMLIPLFHGFGRIGCFFGGCCYGIPSEFGILYHSPQLPTDQIVTRFPVQLLESGLEFLLFFVLYFFLYKPTGPLQDKVRGHLLEIWLGAYAVIRFLDEFLRGDIIRGVWGPFSTSQWISLAVILFFIIKWTMSTKKTAKA